MYKTSFSPLCSCCFSSKTENVLLCTLSWRLVSLVCTAAYCQWWCYDLHVQLCAVRDWFSVYVYCCTHSATYHWFWGWYGFCVQLRTHLGHVHKHQHQQTAINLNNPDSQAMHLETRLVQLDSAINMELWQVSSAFKTACGPIVSFTDEDQCLSKATNPSKKKKMVVQVSKCCSWGVLMIGVSVFLR